MPDPLAQASDVADIWRPLSADEVTRADNLIAKASAMLRAACPFDIDERIALMQTAPDDPKALDAVVVATVVAGIVRRAMVNPDGAVSTTETTGPYSKSSTFALRGSGESNRGELVVLPADIAQLRPKVGYTPPSTIRTRPRHHGPRDGFEHLRDGLRTW